MSRGRCSGCGMEDASCKKVQNHVANCPDYLKLFRENPAAALSPEKEYERRKLEESPEDREARKVTRIAGLREEGTARHASQRARWDRKSS